MLYLEYNGKKYDVGTKVKVNTYRYGEQIMTVRIGGVTGLELHNHNLSMPIRTGMANVISEIVEPIEVQTVSSKPSNGPSPGATDIGCIWYIIIMLGGAIFNDRWLIWIFATIIFVLWSKGIFNKRKK